VTTNDRDRVIFINLTSGSIKEEEIVGPDRKGVINKGGEDR
jgi:hypothetical protein